MPLTVRKPSVDERNTMDLHIATQNIREFESKRTQLAINNSITSASAIPEHPSCLFGAEIVLHLNGSLNASGSALVLQHVTSR